MISHRHGAAVVAGMLALVIAVVPMAAQQAPVRVPTSVLDRYVGAYEQNGTTINIRRNGDTLFREIPGQRMIMQPISETMFRMGPVITAEFVIDRRGGVTQVISDGVDIEYRLPRKGSRQASSSTPRASRVRVPRSV